MNNLSELWRNQTLVNRVGSDSMIATEYYTLVKYVVENYNERMETIQCPLLHLICHCIELKYKEVNLFALQHSYVNGDVEKTRKGHDLQKLSSLFIDVCQKITNEDSCSNEDKDLFVNRVIPNHIKLCDILAASTTTYRYFAKYDKNGNVKNKSIPFVNDKESPNIQELFPIFEDCYSSIIYVSSILDYLFPIEQ